MLSWVPVTSCLSAAVLCVVLLTTAPQGLTFTFNKESGTLRCAAQIRQAVHASTGGSTAAYEHPLLHALWQQASHHYCAHAACSSNCDNSGSRLVLLLGPHMPFSGSAEAAM